MRTLLAGGKGTAAAVLIAAALILFARKTDSFVNPQFWAEDGTIFFAQAYEQGGGSVFTPYAGYLQVVPRLIALAACASVPYRFVPHVCNYMSLAVILFVIWNVFSPRFRVAKKPLIALAVVLVPHYTNEVFMNLANLQTILCVLLITTILKEEPDAAKGPRSADLVYDISVIALCGLTGPYVLFALPVILFRRLRTRSAYSGALAIAVIITSAVQAYLIIKEPPFVQNNIRMGHPIDLWTAFAAAKVMGNLFLGIHLPYHTDMSLIVLSSACVVYILVRFASAEDGAGGHNAVMLYFAFISLLSTAVKFKSFPATLLPPGNGVRYTYVPYIMVAWVLISGLSQSVPWKKRAAAVLLLAILASSLSSGFHSKPYVDFDWGRRSERISPEKAISIPINPPGWQVELRPRARTE